MDRAAERVQATVGKPSENLMREGEFRVTVILARVSVALYVKTRVLSGGPWAQHQTGYICFRLRYSCSAPFPLATYPKMAVPNYSIIGPLCAMNVTIGCWLCSAVSNQSSSGYAYFNVTVIRCQAEFWVCLLLSKQTYRSTSIV